MGYLRWQSGDSGLLDSLLSMLWEERSEMSIGQFE